MGQIRKKKGGGPVTAAGKLVSRQNALKHGLCSKLLLKGENRDEWLAHVQGVVDSLAPVGYLEEQLADDIALLLWRLRRAATYESAALRYQLECRERDAVHSLHAPSDDDMADLAALPDGKAMEKVLRVETHLRRQLDKALDRLARLQQARGQRPGTTVGVVVISDPQKCKTNSGRERLRLSAPPTPEA